MDNPALTELQQWLLARVAQVLSLEPAEIDIAEPFASYGLTSRDAVGVSGDLEERFGRRLSPTLLYDYPSIETLSRHLAGESARQAAPAATAALSEPIAIVGLGCRFPGAEDPAAFWDLLTAGVDAIREVPRGRWDSAAFFDPDVSAPGKINSRDGGFLQHVELFDPGFFGIPAQEAERMDPQQRLLLETSWEALEDAGLTPQRLSGTATGVFVGISTNDYGRVQMSDHTRIDALAGTGNALSIAANRISYLLGLEGPSLAIDTACSSSLVALHLACQSLRSGECETALVGGVNVILSPELTIIFAKAGLLAPDGRCKVFDARADGYVRGEGVGVVVLEPLSKAIAAGRDIYAVIRGSAVNQDGRSNGLMAPNGLAQESVIRRALGNAGVDPGDVSFVEAHGTGTALGDRIEAGALGAAMTCEPDREPCWVGSVKANVGHLEAAAGMAGLIKTALALRNRQIPPNPHFETPNPLIDFESLGLRVANKLRPWPDGATLRRAGVSSFGFGGTNAHVVLEEVPAPVRGGELQHWQLLVLSARTQEALDAVTRNLAAWLESHRDASLADVALTLQTGRTEFEHRRAVAAATGSQALELLNAAVGTPASDEVVHAHPGEQQGNSFEEMRRLLDLGRDWLAGKPVDWPALSGHARLCAGLPTYPFERCRYWFDTAPESAVLPGLAADESKSPIAEWFHVTAWNERPLDRSDGQAESNGSEPTTVLVFCDEYGVGEQLAQRLQRSGRQTVLVRPGNSYARVGDHRTVNPAVLGDYESLLDDLPAPLAEIVHLWSIGNDSPTPAEQIGAVQHLGFESVVCFVQAVGERLGRNEVGITLVASGMAEVMAGDLVSPSKATLLGPCKVIPFEYPQLRCRCLDLAVPQTQASTSLLAGQLHDEIESRSIDQVVAYRDGVRYVQSIVNKPLAAAGEGLRLRKGGVYLLTGGLGGLALSASRYLAEKYQARLILLSRSPLPPREQWDALRAGNDEAFSPTRQADEAMPHRIREVMAIEELGGEVRLMQADVTDPEQMRTAVSEILAHYGQLNGVFHTAGVIGAGLITFTSNESIQHVMAPKLAGSLVLDEVLQDVDLDFMVLYSSLAALLGGPGQVVYSAANAFLDAFAQNRSRRGAWTVAVGWGEWQWNVWEGFAPDVQAFLDENRERFGIAPDEGFEALERILAQDQSHVAVLTRPLEAVRAWLSFLAVDKMLAASGSAVGTSASTADSPVLPPRRELERLVSEVWQGFLGVDNLSPDDNFFDAGGNSLVGLQIINELRRTLGVELPKVAMFQAPTVRALTGYIQEIGGQVEVAPAAAQRDAEREHEAIAIVGVGLRFPGAANPGEFWNNLAGGVESLTYFSDDEMDEVAPELLADPNYVKARPVLENVDLFDADFFGYAPGEARLMDPQLRLFLETCWEALEASGYAIENREAQVGVFAGSNISTYLLGLVREPGFIESVGELETVVTNDRDSLATSVSYKLDLKGPSLTVQTFCSTSATAIHLACQSVLRDECDMALAGGVSVRVPCKTGYLYREGDQYSPDGHTRTFDHQARGTVFGDGVGVVVLKRLSAAIADGDHIHAVIRGSAVNNDGSLKAGYTAPSIDGQAAVVTMALANAGVDAADVSYVEAHGSATVLGDPIEVAALTQAFRRQTEGIGYCALGSVKSNVGHLDRAASVAGVIKTALALEHGQIPPSLHFEQPNPDIDFGSSPFYVNTEFAEWKSDRGPRRAGINCLGIGGTNVHLILEEPPPQQPVEPSRRCQLLLLSARSDSALDEAGTRLASYLRTCEEPALADVAYTLQVGRRSFAHRRIVVCSGRDDAIAAIEAQDERLTGSVQKPVAPQVTFMFPGVGEQYAGMGSGLYRDEPVFREQVDRCADILAQMGEEDLIAALYPAGESDAPVSEQPGEPSTIRTLHPAIFVVEYALARLLMSWGFEPRAMLGYSLGEYVAACLSGVFSLRDALRLMALRGRWIDELPEGAMVAVPLTETEIRPLLGEHLALAANNGPGGVVVSGRTAELTDFEDRLAQRGVVSMRLKSTRAFHSRDLDAVAGPVAELVSTMQLRAPRVPFFSNVTGTWITPEEATDPQYWARHLSHTVRFSDSVQVLLEEAEQVILEVGPGQSLTSLVRLHPQCDADRASVVQPTLSSSLRREPDQAFLLKTLGKLWLRGFEIDWRAFYRDERRRRVPLPTYPFERKRYWRQAPSAIAKKPKRPIAPLANLVRETDVARWLYEPVWHRSPLDAGAVSDTPGTEPWWVFVDSSPLADRIVKSLATRGTTIKAVEMGPDYAQLDDKWVLNPHEPDHYRKLVHDLIAAGGPPRRILHLWNLRPAQTPESSITATLDAGFHSVIYLARALAPGLQNRVEFNLVSSGVHRVAGDEALSPLRATVTGALKVVPLEYPAIATRHFDVDLPQPGTDAEQLLVDGVIEELDLEPGDGEVVYRAGQRWTCRYEQRPLPKPPEAGPNPTWRHGGVYLITGGLGGIGLAIAEYLAATCGARLALVARTALPPREQWDGILASADREKGLARKIAKVRSLEERGVDLLVLSADVANRDQMHKVVGQILDRFGALHGVLHTAGVPAAGLMQTKTASDFARVMAPKVDGTLVLEEVLQAVPVDFLVLFSSITAIVGGGPGQVDYCAANAFLDAYARANTRPDRHVVSIDWAEWQWNDWESSMAGLPADVRTVFQQTRQRLGIDFSSGMDVLERVLNSRRPGFVVSPADFAAMCEVSKTYTVDQLLGQATPERDSHADGRQRPVPARLGRELEKQIAEIWRQALGLEQIAPTDNFFDLGGNSLIGLRVTSKLQRELGREILPLAIYEAPTVRALAGYLEAADSDVRPENEPARPVPRVVDNGGNEIAVIGMAGRFPGADNVEELWELLRQGREGVTFFGDDELIEAGVAPELVNNPHYVKAGGVLNDIDRFDAELFAESPREAELLDPQHRLFLECSWAALEDAGYDPDRYPGKVGVFGGANFSTYLLQMAASPELFASLHPMMAGLANSSDSLTTRVSYKLNLRGPSVAVQSFCSTSAVATHMACSSLRQRECDMALSGGVRVAVPHRVGYLYESGGIDSPDGHTRTFDARGQGALLANGVAILVLKRLDDAIADGDHIYSVIKGSAINNDGSGKVGYTAPSVGALADVVAEALENAQTSPESISYVEAHGTATEIGDPIELAALTRAYRAHTSQKQFCAIGSVKSNLGHLDRAAGTTALIKTSMALARGQLPPSLHFETPNPKLDIGNSPFFVQTELASWRSNGGPRRAAVNALGIGGTNVHFILEEAPRQELAETAASRPCQLLLLSANTETALDKMTDQLLAHIKKGQPEVALPDIAATLQQGRRLLSHRRMFVCGNSTAGAISVLASGDDDQVATHFQESTQRPVVFMFPGLGDHYFDMAKGLYRRERVFRDVVDRSAELLKSNLGLDLREVMFADLHQPEPDIVAGGKPAALDLRRLMGRGDGRGEQDAMNRRLNETWLTQPAVFVVEYALSQLLIEWGLAPEAMIGYSLGEYVAATVAGVFSFEDALDVVARRAQLIGNLPAGSMLAVGLNEKEVRELLGPANEARLSVAALNGPRVAVVSGPESEIEVLEQRLDRDGTAYRRLQTSHAFHSRMMHPIAEPFRQLLAGIELRAPRIPYLSNVSGSWIRAEEATDPAYWVRHMCETVRFEEGLRELLSEPERILLEVGPGQTLGSFARQHPATDQHVVLNTLRGAHLAVDDQQHLLSTLGRLWLTGARIDWQGFYGDERRRRVSLPTYPFEGQRYWIGSRTAALPGVAHVVASAEAAKNPDPSDWFYRQTWAAQPLEKPACATEGNAEGLWLIMADAIGVGRKLAQSLARSVATVAIVSVAEQFSKVGAGEWTIDPNSEQDYCRLLQELDTAPSCIVHLWSLTGGSGGDFETHQEKGFYSILSLAQALGSERITSGVHLQVVSNRLEEVVAGDPIEAAKSTLFAACKVIPQEYPGVSCRLIELDPQPRPEQIAGQLMTELLDGPEADLEVAYRLQRRFVRHYEPVRLGPLDAASTAPGGIRERGVYLITGGLGGVGLLLAEALAREYRARLVLVSRSGLPGRETWSDWLADHAEDDTTSCRMRAVQALEELGAEVLVLAADVADLAALKTVFAAVDDRYGELNGVLHAAGVTERDAFMPVQQTGRQLCARHFHAKVRGVATLADALGDRVVDFCLLFSSLSAVLGGLGFAAYAAANSYMNGFARARRLAGDASWLSVTWDSWQLPGTVNEAQQMGLESTIAAFAMTPAEGVDVFKRLLAAHAGPDSPGPVLVHSTGDLDARIEQWLLRMSRASAAVPARSRYTRPDLRTAYAPVNNDTERAVVRVFEEVLGIDKVGINDNYFDLGGTSLTAIQVVAELQKDFAEAEITPITLFDAPTVAQLARFLGAEDSGGDALERLRASVEETSQPMETREGIAIVGMSGRFPGAADIDELWRNLADGRETVSFFSDEELESSGVEPELFRNPGYVRARPILEDVDLFDAAFFGYSPTEAALLDPQIRIFLETAWQALESAGYRAGNGTGKVGVFAGSNFSTYVLSMLRDSGFLDSVGELQAAITNDRDALATSVSYKLDLKGPSMTVQTFCSTSAVAVHLACQSLRQGECKMALAGGVNIRVPSKVGHLYQAGDQVSPDGHTRTFDHRASGTVFGDGVGVVVLKRLSAAVEDGDRIYAVIRGSAVNNDGAGKIGYTAPSIEAQAEVVASALAAAGVSASEIGYIEAHGTATVLGDPIEVAALTRAFRLDTDARGYCALGSIKTNMGHLDRAAGVSALIKTALALQHRQIPAHLHYERPNPKIDFDSSPFYVNTKLTEWKQNGGPRRAGINSLGVGGTNVHLVLEEAPEPAPTSGSRQHQLLLLSARSTAALDDAGSRLLRYLEHEPHRDLADVAYTLQIGRKAFPHRRMVVCKDRDAALAALADPQTHGAASAVQESGSRQVAFLFPGIGEHYVGMAEGLYRDEPMFREEVDRCASILAEKGMPDLLAVLYPGGSRGNAPAAGSGKLDLRRMLRGAEAEDENGQRLNRIANLHPVLFVVEYSLARLLTGWGVEPQSMMGYSLGEYVAACLAGVFSLEDALHLMAARGRWIDELPEGAMLAVPLGEAEIAAEIGDDLDLAAVNGSGGCVVSGTVAAIAVYEKRLEQRDEVSRRLRSTRAFHSRQLEPVAQRVAELISGMELRSPAIPFISNVTGSWITPDEATDPGYWARHLCRTVRFSDGVKELLSEPARVLVEVGPGQGLTSFVRLHPDCEPQRAARVCSTMRSAFQNNHDQADLLGCLGRLWLAGVEIDWNGFYRHEIRHRECLPTYPFERHRYWLETPAPSPAGVGVAQSLDDLIREPDVAEWIYVPQWRESALPASERVESSQSGPWWVFLETAQSRPGVRGRFAEQLATRLHDAGEEVYRVVPGDSYLRNGTTVSVNPACPDDYQRLVKELAADGKLPRRIVHLWDLEEVTGEQSDPSSAETVDLGFHSLILLAQALGPRLIAARDAHGKLKVDVSVLSRGVHPVTGEETLRPDRATVIGPVKLLPVEYPMISSRHLDIDLPEGGSDAEELLIGNLVAELRAPVEQSVVAYRQGVRWTRGFPRLRLDPSPAATSTRFRQGGVYLITGGLGGLGLATARHLAATLGAKLVLVGRTALPQREQWDRILAEGDPEKGVAHKIATIRALEQQGAELLILSANVADFEQMSAVIDATMERFGALHGVFHTAGVPAAGLMQHKSVADFAEVLEPKVSGTRVLDDVLRDIPIDFLVLFSSATSVSGGGPGQVDYCAANAFLDAFAQARSTPQRRVVSISWNEWRWNAWDAGMAGLPPEVRRYFIETRERLGIDFAEGMDALERIVAADLPYFVVSPADLPALLELGRDYTVDLLTGTAPPSTLLKGIELDSVVGRHARPALDAAFVPASSELEQMIVEIWQRVLGLDEVGVSDNFFDLGGNSLIGLRITSELQRELNQEVLPLALYEAPTVRDLARLLQPTESAQQPVSQSRRASSADDDIAIVGMAGRFPGAESVDELWRNLLQGRESVTFFSDEELLGAGVDPALLKDPSYVKAGSVLKNIDRFDAELFDIPPGEAALLDPQHRLFLQCSWAALEDAGCDPERYPGRIGVFGGTHLSTYLLQVAAATNGNGGIDRRLAGQSNASDSLTTRVSYKLNLRGPSVSVQTFSSTSGVATHLACESLQRGSCDMALAGGVQVSVPHRVGYVYEPGGTDSPDGHTRSFDAKAGGAVLGNGVAIVVLKRLRDALDAGDHIYAVIKGSAINNDGSGKVAYAAPSVNAVADVVTEALDQAGVSPAAISYVEAHGSATEVGDAIEVAALTRAFKKADPGGSLDTQYCAIGSVKSNLGHLVIAAGATALIKTALSLKHRQLPPTLHFNEANPQLQLEQSPFYVQNERADWQSNGMPRRAGVNILGIGGTNVHFILEEPPAIEAGQRSPRPLHLLPLSANTASALEAMTDRLASHLRNLRESVELSDVCATLQRGRKLLAHRRFVVCRDIDDAVLQLETRDAARVSTHFAPPGRRTVCFLFPRHGAQRAVLSRDLYEHEVEFRSAVDECCQELLPHLGTDLRDVLFPAPAEKEHALQQLAQTKLTEPAVFVIEYALARQWMAWGVGSRTMFGDGIGEYVAACLAGVFSLPDALALVVERGRVVAEPDNGVVLQKFRDRIANAASNPPQLPWISSVTGTQIRPEQALDPDYWVSQTREPKHLDAGLDQLLAVPGAAILEVGRGGTLATLLRARGAAESALMSSLSESAEGESEYYFVLTALGKLWQAGVEIDWQAFHRYQRLNSVPLPTYPFEGDSHWTGPRMPTQASHGAVGNGGMSLHGFVKSIRAIGSGWLNGRRKRESEKRAPR